MTYSLSITGHLDTATSDDIIAAADAAFASMPGAISGSVSGTDGSGASFSSSLPSNPVTAAQDATTADATASADASATPADATASVDPSVAPTDASATDVPSTVLDTPADVATTSAQDSAAVAQTDPTATDAAVADATAASTSDPTADQSPTIVDFFTEAEAQAIADKFGGTVEHRGTAWHVDLP